ncbi:MAG TPA: tRNA (adenosine(37)-N6)-threonylcarbamoyltransferase complex ATPase subunit type 1 TsaE [Kiritimatiellia bacterium]|nr:tRNA (adenosine(37)-N6)-threonylcarbamoyltransferase complex ATPase subunit type 1 TsaE [Kiritimatiellia bacterium]
MNKALPPVITDSPEATMEWAANWVATLPRGAVIALHGELGAGKTCFVKGLAKGLNVQGPVHSPTFTLVNEYRGAIPLYHLDLYRLHGEEEAWDIGIENYLESDGITAIEWAERISHLLPDNTLHVCLDYGAGPDQRVIKQASEFPAA